MFRFTHLFLLSSVLLLSCVEEGDDTPVAADSSAVLVCDCELPEAVDVSYDNNNSSLAATEVQGALSELAERPAPEIPDFADRLEFVERESVDVNNISLTSLAGCNGGVPGHTVLGGGCKTDDPNATLVEAKIVPGLGFRCRWKKSIGVTVTGSSQATCVAPSP